MYDARRTADGFGVFVCASIMSERRAGGARYKTTGLRGGRRGIPGPGYPLETEYCPDQEWKWIVQRYPAQSVSHGQIVGAIITKQQPVAVTRDARSRIPIRNSTVQTKSGNGLSSVIPHNLFRMKSDPCQVQLCSMWLFDVAWSRQRLQGINTGEPQVRLQHSAACERHPVQ